jgi:hypothetical protein
MDTTTDPVELLRSLSADALQERLDAVLAEADALRVLLRSARARERRRDHQAAAAGQGVSDAG